MFILGKKKKQKKKNQKNKKKKKKKKKPHHWTIFWVIWNRRHIVTVLLSQTNFNNTYFFSVAQEPKSDLYLIIVGVSISQN